MCSELPGLDVGRHVLSAKAPPWLRKSPNLHLLFLSLSEQAAPALADPFVAAGARLRWDGVPAPGPLSAARASVEPGMLGQRCRGLVPPRDTAHSVGGHRQKH